MLVLFVPLKFFIHLNKKNYFVDADVHVPWSPDVEVQQTVLINPPKNIVVRDHVTAVI